jgi:hypothetical protein
MLYGTSKIDLLAILRCLLDVSEAEDGCPMRELALYGLQLPTDVQTHSIKLVHPIDSATLGDCADFEDNHHLGDDEHPFELRLLWYGAKDTVLLLGASAQLRVLGATAVKRGYHALLTPYSWTPVREPAKGGYSNLMHCASLKNTGVETRRGLVIARSENDLALAWLSSTLRWDSLLGRVLGYPSCCVRSFCERWPEAQARHTGDLIPLVIKSSGPGPFDWRTNVLGRYFNRCLLQHFPCTFGCRPSIELAELTLRHLNIKEPVLANSIKRLMCAPVIYTEQAGIFSFPQAEVDLCDGEWGMRYDPKHIIASTRDFAIYRYLSDANTVLGLVGCTLRMDAEADAYLLRFA